MGRYTRRSPEIEFKRVNIPSKLCDEIRTELERETNHTEFSFILRSDLKSHSKVVYNIDSYSYAWRRDYEAEKFWTVDPILKIHSPTPYFPTIWSDDFIESKLFLQAGKDYGFLSGMSIGLPCSFGNYGVLSIASLKQGSLQGVDPLDWSACVLKVYAKLIDYINRQHSLQRIFNDHQQALNDREIDILRYTADGMSSTDIAMRMHLSKSSIDYHIAKILQKLDSPNKHQALALAIKKGKI
ncbi:LuxR family transcriptional regulator [Pseudomonas protegens]|jgi:LuxR family transcriptional regulator|nr:MULTISPECIES: LuxR C-terminal-related transcriptional regulator [Pseudomonas]GED79065.1 LuxR family transcriptional regulator [Pseudomonas fluorescens]AQT10597.1 LuxR family transcriptional regulator [Pseudomonas protegens]MBF0642908.1 autoinducer binding domain-containing protein [Pseudomonas protegens]MBP5098044.1 autoinducer binding domain-containing protein [Pseudomonas protegens]MBP5105908.1 autoinducer binding domain-containing protein [Pseudomonas protegens]